MNRLKYLKNVLMGPVEAPATEEEAKWHEWATVHAPLRSPSLSSLTGRHLNHFCVGSDPEFALADGHGHIVGAYNCGLKVGLAAGCDQNERLVELRPWPSVSVVEHVAGILTALRWMHRTMPPETRTFPWRAGAFYAGDGLGGHVHFGRKRPTRTEETAALDGLANALKASGLFPVDEWNRRMQGDERAQQYGRPGDVRIQKHGYEYRSLPSWLQSPTTAFIAVAASKLAVLDPSITVNWSAKVPSVMGRDLLRGLAKLFKSRDDDAYVLYHLLTQRGDTVFDVDYRGNFAPAWGFEAGGNDARHLKAEESFILPDLICPEPEEVVEMRNHLLLGYPLTFTKYPPNFRTELPDGNYQWVPLHVHPGRRSGFGDLVHNLVTHRHMPIIWDHTNHSPLQINGPLPHLWNRDEIDLFRRYCPGALINNNAIRDGRDTVISVPRDLTQTGTISGLRAILLQSGLFPVWTVEDVKANSFADWKEKHSKMLGTQKFWRKV
jgi:hypothetical protein